MISREPVWAAFSIPAYAAPPRGTLSVDVAVIGGGLAGLSAAYHLLERRPGARVAVLEAGRLGAGASGRSTGLLGPGVGQSLAALVRRYGTPRARALYVETLRAVEAVKALVARERIDCELDMTGQLLIARSRRERARLGREAGIMTDLGLPFVALDDDALDRAVRIARSNRGASGPAALRLPVAGTLHPLRLVAGLAGRVIARGGVICEGARVTALNGDQPVRLAIAGGGEVRADRVVIATAGYTPDLGLMRGRVLPVHLQVVATEPLESAALGAIGWKGREGLIDARRIFSYSRLTADDRIVFGGGEPRYAWGGRTDGDSRHASALDDLVAELCRTFGPDVPLRVAGGWTGVIGYVLDTLPAIGRLRDRPSAIHAVGWCGHGLALSVASGAWVTAMLCDGAAPADLPWYRDDPPLVPFEPARWLAFRAAVKTMALLDTVG